MTEHTANLQLPFLAAGQAQKHITVNETLTRLDALLQLAAVSATIDEQPAAPEDGDVYILPSGKSGDTWDAMADGALAYYRDGAWEEIAPREGWIAFVRDADAAMVFAGSVWAPLTSALHVSATDTILGRVSSGAGAAEEISFTDQAQQLCDDASFAAMRATLGAAGLADDNSFTGANTLAKPTLTSNGAFTTASYGKAAELAKGTLFFVPKGAGSYAWGWGVAGDAFYVVRSGADDDSAGAVPVFACSPSSFVFEGNAVFYGGASPLPSVDNAIDLGSASFRFATVYAATGTINTSDAREKTSFQAIPDEVKRAVRRIVGGIGAHQWRDAVSEKGAEHARLHVGVTAQAVRDAFLAEGADPERWALFCEDALVETVALPDRARPAGSGQAVEPIRETRPVLDETGAPLTRLGLRTDQLMWLILAALAEDGRD